ncbi:MAG: hypothetical protein ABWY05_13540 [Noviherbaspirillum sp.]
MKLKFIPIAFLGAALVACGGGGGGGGGGSTTAQTLQVTAKVDGVVVSGYPTTAASAPAITLSSGQELEITSSTQTAFGGNLNGAVAAVRVNNGTTYRAVLASSATTDATLTFTTTALPLQTTTVPVRVNAASFAPVLPKVGDSFVYSESVVQLNGTATTLPSTRRRVDAVRADGSWSETNLSPSNVELDKVELTRDGNRTVSIATAANPRPCNDRTPPDRDSRFIVEEKLLEFPLTVGKKYTGAWVATCGLLDRQDESITAEVIGYESITTPAGVFNALRIKETTRITNSTNNAFLGQGYTQEVDVWFDPVLGRNIKFSGVRTYGSPNVARTLVQRTTIQLESYVKN